MRPSKSSRHTRRPTSRPRKQKIDKSEKSGKADKSGGDAGGKGRKPDKGTAWSRFLLGNRTVLGPSVYFEYKKYCETFERDHRFYWNS
eukprot:3327922-Prymnesium_polylepis.1